jgi:lipooligosaccharide transport system permease protein
MLRVVEREFRVFARLWRGFVFSTFLNPVLFLAAMGVGLGGLVDNHTGTVEGFRYLEFVAPGLLVASATQVAAGESLWPVMLGTKWMRYFHGIVATPISPADLYGGFVIWAVLRTAFASSVFLLVAAVLGAIPSAWGILAVPAAALCAAAFCAPLAAYAATQDAEMTFPVIMRIGILPLFLFSGAFFPISQLPRWVQLIAAISPLWHGVELARAATTAQLGWGIPAHAAVLVACITAGWRWGTRTFTHRLAA